MISPSAPVTSPAGAANSNLDRTSSRRRGLSYLRALSHSRSGNTSPNEPSRSPRHYFQRSLSYNNDHRPTLPPAPAFTPTPTSRRRSHSRPNEPTSPLAFPSETTAPGPSLSPLPAGRISDPTLTTSSSERNEQEDMARHRTSAFRRNTTSHQQPATEDTNHEAASRPSNQRSQSATNTNTTGSKDSTDEPKASLPTIRFHPHQEIRNGRPSLTFSPVSRTLPSDLSIIRVGRYSEREGVPSANPTAPSDAPVGFKSKVVSRKHCEFCFVDGQWQIKDVASSSGTFLNHIRLSQPNTESRLFPIKDGDIVQLGIDFRGGEEMIFRCVKIRIECNRAWQKKPNNFNKTRHQQLQSLAKDQPSADANSGECSICLGSVLPCQALFVAPCAHVWHYKCIRPLLEGKNSTYPQFQCPNCRAYSDLAADVDLAQSDLDEWMEGTEDSPIQQTETGDIAHVEPLTVDGSSTNGQVIGRAEINGSSSEHNNEQPRPSVNTTFQRGTAPAAAQKAASQHEASNSPTSLRGGGLLARRQASNATSPEIQSMNGNIDMPDHPDEDEMNVQLEHQRTRTQTPDIEHVAASGEGPLTPRNNAGPFVFDGSAGRSDAMQLQVPGIPEVTGGSEHSHL